MSQTVPERPTPPKAVIFDLDGVIFDSAECNVAFYNHILSALGHEPRAREALEVIHTEPMDRSLQYLLGHGEEYRRAVAYWKSLDPTPFIHMLELYPGVTEALAMLGGRARLAVATNRTSTARPVLRYFELLHFFEAVVTPIEAGVSKPDPGVMAMTLDLLGLTVDEGLCRNSGARLVAFRNPGLEAWAHLHDFADLAPLLGLD